MTVDAPLSQLEVLAVDCQATAASPRGHLLEIGWTRVGAGVTGSPVRAHLIAPPRDAHIPPAVTRITGIDQSMLASAIDARDAWRELVADAATIAPQPPIVVIHFARFELPFLHALGGGAVPFHVVCTHEIARRLLPNLPRRGLRALAGYFGRAVGELRRSADHVEATTFVWHEVLQLLAANGVTTWSALQQWLQQPAAVPARRRRAWPMPREVRLALPDAPGVYRMLRTSGDVLYVGKAASLHHRVNSYFRKQQGVPDRLLEMLSQARAISFDVAPSALEAALLEADEIKRHRAPYNIAPGRRRSRAVVCVAGPQSARPGALGVLFARAVLFCGDVGAVRRLGARRSLGAGLRALGAGRRHVRSGLPAFARGARRAVT